MRPELREGREKIKGGRALKGWRADEMCEKGEDDELRMRNLGKMSERVEIDVKMEGIIETSFKDVGFQSAGDW